MEDISMRIKLLANITLAILLAVGALACGGGSDPVNNNNHNQNTDGVKLVGRILDREGTPVGIPFAKVKITSSAGSEIAPTQQPAAAGADAGQFEFVGLPIGIPLTFEAELVQPSLGVNLGWVQQVKLTGGGTFDLGDITLENDFINMGWDMYVAKDYTNAIYNFQRAFEDRTAQANLSNSSSAYTGLGWVYAKRGKCYSQGLMYTDSDTGEWLDTINSFEWDQALANFDKATTNFNDSDAWVGMGGTYLTLVGQANKDPQILGPWIPFYCFIHFYFGEAEDALNKGLKVDPDYNSSHDEISANDVRATIMFLDYMKGAQVTPEEVTNLAKSSDLNQGSRQLLEGMVDLVQYNPFPQL
jgi:hypothetical protein